MARENQTDIRRRALAERRDRVDGRRAGTVDKTPKTEEHWLQYQTGRVLAQWLGLYPACAKLVQFGKRNLSIAEIGRELTNEAVNTGGLYKGPPDDYDVWLGCGFVEMVDEMRNAKSNEQSPEAPVG
jgi:hypothetical protein